MSRWGHRLAWDKHHRVPSLIPEDFAVVDFEEEIIVSREENSTRRHALKEESQKMPLKEESYDIHNQEKHQRHKELINEENDSVKGESSGKKMMILKLDAPRMDTHDLHGMITMPRSPVIPTHRLFASITQSVVIWMGGITKGKICYMTSKKRVISRWTSVKNFKNDEIALGDRVVTALTVAGSLPLPPTQSPCRLGCDTETDWV
uniref:Uncharacterized protein n=1 Tax=Oryza brachyantha TaxID=4533 RepID=J3ME45_ORYBR